MKILTFDEWMNKYHPNENRTKELYLKYLYYQMGYDLE